MNNKLSEGYKNDKMVGQGRAIARGMHLEQVQREKNMAKAVKRKSTMLENAAERALFSKN